MASTVANQYDQGVGLKDSFVNLIKLNALDNAPVLNMLKESKASQKVHTWYGDTVEAATGTVQNTAVEGADVTMASTDVAAFTEYTNYVQNVMVHYKLSGDMVEAEYKGIAEGQEAYQRKKAMRKWALDYEKALIMGASASGASGTARQMNGVDYWCSATTANTVAATATDFGGSATGQGKLDSALAAIFASSGEYADTAILSAATQLYVNQWTNYGTRFHDADKDTFTSRIKKYATSFGDIKLVVSTVVGNAQVLIFDSTSTYNAYFRKPILEKLGKVGDSEQYMIIGSGTLEVRNPLAAGQVTLA